MISGSLGEEQAVECVLRGATDYVLKQKPGRLVPAVLRALTEAEELQKRREAEAAVREGEARYRIIFENAIMAISQALPDGRLLCANQAYAEMYGYLNPAEMIAEVTSVGELYANPDDRDEVLRILNEKGVIAPREISVIRRDGSRIVVLVAAQEIRDPAGNLLFYQAEQVDITARKRAEQELNESKALTEAVVENIPLMLFLKEATDLRFVMFNRAGEELLGYDRKELLGKNNLDLFPPEQAAHFMAKDREVLDGEMGMVDIPEEPILTAKNGQRLLHTRKVCIRGAAGATKYLLGISEDITEHKRDEEAIRELNAKLEQRVCERTAQLEAANKELEAFSYSVSHDLRAPLRAIEGFSGIMVEDYGERLGDEGRRLLGVVRANTAKMGLLIEDLLAFSRSSGSEMRHGRLDMGVMARTVFAEIVADPGARTRIDFTAGELPDAEGDAALVRQVWVNLLSNAVKFTSLNPRSVIGVAGVLEGDEVVYHVRDNGVGFDPQYAHKLFGVFQRLHRADEFEGTGIGLANVRRIIARHGGRTWAEGKLNEGATFFFTLRSATATNASL